MGYKKTIKKKPSYDYSIYDDFDFSYLEKHKDKVSIPAVYFLFFKDELVYIGKTKSLFSRLERHYSENKKTFDSWAYIDVPINDLTNVETLFIKKYAPIYNNDMVAYYSRKEKEFKDTCHNIKDEYYMRYEEEINQCINNIKK